MVSDAGGRSMLIPDDREPHSLGLNFHPQRIGTRGTEMTFIDESASRTELEGVIVGDGALYAQFNETRLLNDGYTTDEMRQIVMAWIAAGDECQ